MQIAESAPVKARAPRGAKVRERLAAAGVTVDDIDRPADGRRRKPRSVPLKGMRDGPNMPLRNVNYEDFARHIAGGLPVAAAWRAAGYKDIQPEAWRSVNDPDFIARVAELRAIFNEGPKLSVPYLQERLAALTAFDITDFVEKIPLTTNRYRPKDLTTLPPEVRAAIASWTIDKEGRLNVQAHDKTKLFEVLMRALQPSAGVNVGIQVNAPIVDRLHAAMRRAGDIEAASTPQLPPAAEVIEGTVASAQTVEAPAAAVDAQADAERQAIARLRAQFRGEA